MSEQQWSVTHYDFLMLIDFSLRWCAMKNTQGMVLLAFTGLMVFKDGDSKISPVFRPLPQQTSIIFRHITTHLSISWFMGTNPFVLSSSQERREILTDAQAIHSYIQYPCAYLNFFPHIKPSSWMSDRQLLHLRLLIGIYLLLAGWLSLRPLYFFTRPRNNMHIYLISILALFLFTIPGWFYIS